MGGTGGGGRWRQLGHRGSESSSKPAVDLLQLWVTTPLCQRHRQERRAEPQSCQMVPLGLCTGAPGWGVTIRIGGVGLLVGFVGFVFKDLVSSPNRCFSGLSLIPLI